MSNSFNTTNNQSSDKELLELLQLMDSFSPIIPDGLIEFYMNKAGVECDDIRLYSKFASKSHY